MAACKRCKKPTNLDSSGIILPTYTGIGSDLGLCQSCRSNRLTDVWEAAPDWNTLLQLNLLFLRGEVDVNVNHAGPLDEETVPLVPGLIKLHEYGILTCGSQPFEKSSRYLPGKGWAQKRQRPYLEFMLPTLHPDIPIDNVDTFIERLFADASILVSVYSECDEYLKTEDTMRSKRLNPLQYHGSRPVNVSVSHERLLEQRDHYNTSTGENFQRPNENGLEKVYVLPLYLRLLLEHWRDSVRR